MRALILLLAALAAPAAAAEAPAGPTLAGRVVDGANLLIAPAKHRVRIEFGRGLERALTDADAQAIVDPRNLPALRAGRFDQGVLRGAAAIIREVDKT